MSKPLSILTTILLLIVPSLLADRCTAETPTVHPCTTVSVGGPSAPAGVAEPGSHSGGLGRGRPSWRGPARWAFVAQGLVISIVHHIVLDFASETK